MQTFRIPFNKPCLMGKELDYIADAVTRGHSAGDGRYTKLCCELLEQTLGAARVLLTTSCTHALELAALLLDIAPGDEVILPSFTFVSTANAFALRGARPVFADIRPDTLCLDEAQVSSLVTDRTRAIVPVHYAGVGCDMDTILHVSRRRGINVIEDNAHGLFGKYREKPLGTFGSLATLSFHETKNVICGEGGALIINDESYVERAEILREKGTNRSRFFRGQVDKYTWVDVGSSFLPSDILAAFLFAQLESYTQIAVRRCRIWHTYDEGLRDWAKEHGVRQPVVPHDRKQAYHMYYLVMPSLAHRRRLIDFLRAQGILAVFHYVPLHLSDMGRKFGAREGQFPVTERIGDCLVRLPFFNSMSETEQAEVIEAVQRFDG